MEDRAARCPTLDIFRRVIEKIESLRNLNDDNWYSYKADTIVHIEKEHSHYGMYGSGAYWEGKLTLISAEEFFREKNEDDYSLF